MSKRASPRAARRSRAKLSGTDRSSGRRSRSATRPSPSGVTPSTQTAGMPASLPISRPAAAASWSTVAVAVTWSTRPARSGRPASGRRSARCPEQPIATSTSPSRQGRPKVSLTITASGPAPRAASAARSRARRAVRILRQQHGDLRARRVREIDARVRAHEAVSRLADQHAVPAPHDRAAFRAGSPRCGAGSLACSCAIRRASAEGVDARERHQPALGLRYDLLTHDQDAAGEREPRARGRLGEQRREVVPRRHQRDTQQRRQTQAVFGSCRGRPGELRAAGPACAAPRCRSRAGRRDPRARRRRSRARAGRSRRRRRRRGPRARGARAALSGPKPAGITSRGTRSSARGAAVARRGQRDAAPGQGAPAGARSRPGVAPATSPSTTSTPSSAPGATIAAAASIAAFSPGSGRSRTSAPALRAAAATASSGVTTATRASAGTARSASTTSQSIARQSRSTAARGSCRSSRDFAPESDLAGTTAAITASAPRA